MISKEFWKVCHYLTWVASTVAVDIWRGRADSNYRRKGTYGSIILISMDSTRCNHWWIITMYPWFVCVSSVGKTDNIRFASCKCCNRKIKSERSIRILVVSCKHGQKDRCRLARASRQRIKKHSTFRDQKICFGYWSRAVHWRGSRQNNLVPSVSTEDDLQNNTLFHQNATWIIHCEIGARIFIAQARKWQRLERMALKWLSVGRIFSGSWCPTWPSENRIAI